MLANIDVATLKLYNIKTNGIKFRSEFLGWIEGSLKSDRVGCF